MNFEAGNSLSLCAWHNENPVTTGVLTGTTLQMEIAQEC